MSSWSTNTGGIASMTHSLGMPSGVVSDGLGFMHDGCMGAFITMGVLPAILNVIDLGMTMTEAVAAPRFTANSNAVDVSNRIPRFVTDELENRGYPVVRSPFGYVFAGVHGIRLDADGWDGGADPGRDGMALAVISQ